MLDHRRNQVLSRKALVGESELLVLRLLLPHQLAWLHSEHAEDGVDLLCRRRSFQILEDLGLDAMLPEQADRLLGLASAGVVPDGNSHREGPPHRQS